MKYIAIEWPEIQNYMGNPDFQEECYFDPMKNTWFIPEDWEDYEPEYGTEEYFDYHDCWDAIGGDWEE